MALADYHTERLKDLRARYGEVRTTEQCADAIVELLDWLLEIDADNRRSKDI